MKLLSSLQKVISQNKSIFEDDDINYQTEEYREQYLQFINQAKQIEYQKYNDMNINIETHSNTVSEAQQQTLEYNFNNQVLNELMQIHQSQQQILLLENSNSSLQNEIFVAPYPKLESKKRVLPRSLQQTNTTQFNLQLTQSEYIENSKFQKASQLLIINEDED